jgi:hypothetical protein
MEATMGKRFVSVRDADKRAIELYLMLREVEQPKGGLKLQA